MGKAEEHVEGYLRRRVEAAGGTCPKWVAPGKVGVPDRIVVLLGRVVFVETKAPGGKPRPIQLARHRELRAAGADVRVIDTRDQVDDLIRELTTVPEEGARAA